MKITPLRIITTQLPNGYGTGRVKGHEIVPFTRTAQAKIGIDPIVDLPAPPKLESKNVDYSLFNALREYQQDDVLLMANRNVGMLLSEPRTGKTPTALAIFTTKGVKKYIVICPTSIILQWTEEVEKWTDLEATYVRGTKKQRINTYDAWQSGVIVVGYESFRNDHEEAIKLNPDIEGMIIDESHRINNRKTLQYKSVKKLSRVVKHKLFLTGTLSPNKQDEIFGTLSAAYPEIFTGYWRFINYYFKNEMVKNWQTGRSYPEIGELLHPTELQEFLERVSVNRTQKEVMPWLPDKDYVRIRLEPTKQQLKYLKDLDEIFEIEGTDIITQGILDRLIRIRQILNDPGILELKGKSPKTEWIKQFLKDYPDKPVVIFSNFTTYLKILSKELEIPNLIIGETPTEERNTLKNAFQQGTIKVLLINIVAGKEGLTLDTAHGAIFCDNFPPAADIYQAENRITATTPERSSKPNTIYQLMMKDQYDESLYDMVKENISETDVINKYKEYLADRRIG